MACATAPGRIILAAFRSNFVSILVLLSLLLALRKRPAIVLVLRFFWRQESMPRSRTDTCTGNLLPSNTSSRAWTVLANLLLLAWMVVLLEMRWPLASKPLPMMAPTATVD